MHRLYRVRACVQLLHLQGALIYVHYAYVCVFTVNFDFCLGNSGVFPRTSDLRSAKLMHRLYRVRGCVQLLHLQGAVIYVHYAYVCVFTVNFDFCLGNSGVFPRTRDLRSAKLMHRLYRERGCVQLLYLQGALIYVHYAYVCVFTVNFDFYLGNSGVFPRTRDLRSAKLMHRLYRVRACVQLLHLQGALIYVHYAYVCVFTVNFDFCLGNSGVFSPDEGSEERETDASFVSSACMCTVTSSSGRGYLRALRVCLRLYCKFRRLFGKFWGLSTDD
jgi:hypothetical protein